MCSLYNMQSSLVWNLIKCDLFNPKYDYLVLRYQQPLVWASNEKFQNTSSEDEET